MLFALANIVRVDQMLRAQGYSVWTALKGSSDQSNIGKSALLKGLLR
ncbi:hypothetical protein ADIMK_0454 [Marinobacterium lacunae]|uniref:Uncharacterized protein n=1 Tax=Marinobacterium lacunae TaxID=1232683 RepID=A0A081G3Z2_9GAMM|nr:hypothetical protein ADIMK_0454 [Marinobacterium lacunae]